MQPELILNYGLKGHGFSGCGKSLNIERRESVSSLYQDRGINNPFPLCHPERSAKMSYWLTEVIGAKSKDPEEVFVTMLQ